MSAMTMQDAFLTTEEVERLTGYRKPALQVRKLKSLGVPHYINRLGRPVVRRDFGVVRETKELGAVR